MLMLLVLAVCTTCSFAQSVPTFSLSSVKSNDDLNPAAQKAAAYILATPADTTDRMRRTAEAYLFEWMEKTKEYHFDIDMSIAKVLEESHEEAYVLFAGMTEFAFNHKDAKGNEMKLWGMKRLINYTLVETNKLPAGAELKKIIKADKKGGLEKYLAEEK